MLARLSQSQRAAEGFLGEFDFSHLVDELYHLTFDDFCDWYAEAVKQRLYDGDADARATAHGGAGAAAEAAASGACRTSPRRSGRTCRIARRG